MEGALSIYLKSKEWHDNRRNGIGGSDASILADGVPERVHELWLLKTGRIEPGILLSQPVLFGVVTEKLNTHWYQSVTGRKVWGEGDERIHPDYEWMRHSLDGITTSMDGREALYEAKTVNAFSNIHKLIAKYKAQCMHGMGCGGWDVAVLSAFIGTLRYEYAELEFDPFYWLELLDLEKEFWQCVVEDREPGNGIMRGIR